MRQLNYKLQRKKNTNHVQIQSMQKIIYSNPIQNYCNRRKKYCNRKKKYSNRGKNYSMQVQNYCNPIQKFSNCKKKKTERPTAVCFNGLAWELFGKYSVFSNLIFIFVNASVKLKATESKRRHVTQHNKEMDSV